MAKSPGIRAENVEFRHAVNEPPESIIEFIDRLLNELVCYYRHSAVGRRCTGVIHNMNTPLQVISFQLELLEQKVREESALLIDLMNPMAPRLQNLHEYRDQKLKQMHQEVDKLRDMIHRLTLQAVHEGEEEHCYLDLNEIFQDELELYLANPFFKHRVEKEFKFTEGLPPIHGHYVDFSQSFRHLVDNALEAMAESPRRLLTVTTHIEGNCRVLRVGDTGVGISPSDQDRLLEPFFTTRRTNHKSKAGLGLYMTRRMLEPYQGEISFESRPGQTWAIIHLPIA